MVKDTTWETSEQVAICFPPILAPIFFGQKPVEASIYDHNFVNRMASISQTHGVWAKLILEIFNQQENDNGDIDKIIDGPIKKLQKKGTANDYILPTGHVPDTPYFFLYQLRSPAKWPQTQERLSDYFIKKSNPNACPSPPTHVSQ
jgi:hypothetical protein